MIVVPDVNILFVVFLVIVPVFDLFVIHFCRRPFWPNGGSFLVVGNLVDEKITADFFRAEANESCYTFSPRGSLFDGRRTALGRISRS